MGRHSGESTVAIASKRVQRRLGPWASSGSTPSRVRCLPSRPHRPSCCQLRTSWPRVLLPGRLFCGVSMRDYVRFRTIRGRLAKAGSSRVAISPRRRAPSQLASWEGCAYGTSRTTTHRCCRGRHCPGGADLRCCHFVVRSRSGSRRCDRCGDEIPIGRTHGGRRGRSAMMPGAWAASGSG